MNGELEPRQCPPDTHWNQAGGTCDLPEVAQCPNAVCVKNNFYFK